MERRFPRTVDALGDVFGFVSEFAAGCRLDEDAVFQIKLAIEEVFVNMVRHNAGSRDVLVGLAREQDRLVVSLTDFDVEAFDITKADTYDTGQPLDKRPIGRLGIHLVRNMVDEISYQYENRQSRITLIKDLGKTDV
jgi:serine/threonine-protein kinase RsbW